MQHSPSAGALSTSFLLNHASTTGPSWMHWLQNLGSCSWVWVVSQKDWRNQEVTGWILAFESKMQFSCFPVLPSSAEAQVIWGGIVKCLLIADYIITSLPKKYQNPFTCVKVIASQRWDFFDTRCSYNYTVYQKMSLLCLAITLTHMNRFIDFDNFWHKCYWESKRKNQASFDCLLSK